MASQIRKITSKLTSIPLYSSLMLADKLMKSDERTTVKRFFLSGFLNLDQTFDNTIYFGDTIRLAMGVKRTLGLCIFENPYRKAASESLGIMPLFNS